jgi:negative regulator of flagellin synthesis FlgM
LPIKKDAASPILDGGGNQMQINPTYAGPTSPEPARQSQLADAVDPPRDLFVATSGLADRRHAASLDPARAERIRSRVLSGAYDTLKVVDTIARRLLDGEDL